MSRITIRNKILFGLVAMAVLSAGCSKDYEQEIAGAAFVGLSEKPEYSPSKESTKSPNPIMDYLIKVIQKRFGKMSGNEAD